MLFLIILILFAVSLGKSLGLKDNYAKLLLRIFEFGQKRIEKAEKRGSRSNYEDEETDIKANGGSVISREVKLVLEPPSEVDDENRSLPDSLFSDKHEFHLEDALDFIRGGVEAIVEDEVTKCFAAEELPAWNLLTRTNKNYQFISIRLTLIWGMGFFLRYVVLFPIRLFLTVFGVGWLLCCTAVVGCIQEGRFKRWLYNLASLSSFYIFSCACSAIVTYHNRFCTMYKKCTLMKVEGKRPRGKPKKTWMEVVRNDMKRMGLASTDAQDREKWRKGIWGKPANPARTLSNDVNISSTIEQPVQNGMAKNGGICVANHTSPIDVVILASDNSYALVGQSHGGFLGVLQSGLARATSHIWFERSEIKDREFVTKRLREHVENETKLPILVFPEGTCINNTSVMMFKKGSFEVGGTIYPVAIKYNPKFGDPFWNSSRQSYMHYLLMMLTSWAIVCDVWYLPPMTRKADERAVDFANRVKAEIACQGGLVDLMWDGQLKRMKVKQEWIEIQQKEFSRRIKVE